MVLKQFLSVLIDPSTRQPLGLQRNPNSISQGYNNSPGQGTHKNENVLEKPRRWDPYQSDTTPSALCSSAVRTSSYKTREQYIITVLERSIGQRFGSPPYLHLMCVCVCVCVCERKFGSPRSSIYFGPSHYPWFF